VRRATGSMRRVDDGAAEGEALFPSAGELGDAAIEVGANSGEVDDVVFALRGLRALEAIDAGVEVEVFLHGEVFVEAELLAHVADMLLDLGGIFDYVHAENGAGAGGWREESAKSFDDGGFTGTVGAEEAEDLTFAYLEADVVDRSELAKADGEVAGGDGRSLGGWRHFRRTEADMPDLRVPAALST